jgi:hypothetical protein
MPTITTAASSKGQVAKAVGVYIGPAAGTASPAYINIGETDEASFSGRKWSYKDATSFSTSGDDTALQGTRTPGEIKLGGVRDSADPGQQALQAGFIAGGLYMFEVVLPINTAAGQVTQGDVWNFNAYVEEFDPASIKLNDVIKYMSTLKIDGNRTFTPGS